MMAKSVGHAISVRNVRKKTRSECSMPMLLTCLYACTSSRVLIPFLLCSARYLLTCVVLSSYCLNLAIYPDGALSPSHRLRLSPVFDHKTMYGDCCSRSQSPGFEIRIFVVPLCQHAALFCVLRCLIRRWLQMISGTMRRTLTRPVSVNFILTISPMKTLLGLCVPVAVSLAS